MILSNIPSNKSKKVLIECDFKSTSKCKLKYEKVYRNVLKCRFNNNGKDRCIYCFNSLTKTGVDNYNYKYSKNEDFFKIINSELKAYLLGWVAGDGCLKKDGMYMSVHKNDKEIIDLFCSSISPNYEPFFREYDNTVNLAINSVILVSDLCRHLKVDVGKKSHKISLPDINEKFLAPFIRGLFDSDGHVGALGLSKKSPNCSYCSMSPVIRDQIFEYCNTNGIKTMKGKYSIGWTGHNANAFMSLVYKKSKYHLSRKYNLYREWSTWRPYNGTKNFPRKNKK